MTTVIDFRDRTNEFYNLAERIKKRGGVQVKRQGTPKLSNGQGGASSRSEFTRMAAQLGRSIASTSEKLEQLTYLTKAKNHMNDNPVEINTMTQDIKQDITKLNHQLKILQSVQKGTKSYNKQAIEHTNNVIMSLQTKLADTSLGFKDVLELEVTNTTTTAAAVNVQQSPQPRRRVTNNHRDSPVYNVYDKQQQEQNDTPQSLGIPMISQQQQQLLVEQQDRRIENRSNAMETIESTIAELGGIFQQLATMVAEQRETIQRIDQNTDDIEMNVLSAQSELMKYYTNISSNRGFIIKVFVTVILLFIFFSVVM